MNSGRIVHLTTALATAMALGLGGTASATAANSPGTPEPSPSSSLTTLPGQPAPNLVTIKARCEAEISKRLTTLGEDAIDVSKADALAASDRATLLGIIANDNKGLSALNTKIAADTDIKTLRADCESIVTGYRVYVLLGPQIHLVVAADQTTALDSQMGSVAGELKAALQNCVAGPAVCQKADAALNDLNAKITASQQAVAGVSSNVLALTPAGYPGNALALKSAAVSVTTAKGDLEGARADINTILEALGGHTNPGSPAPTAGPGGSAG